MYTKANVMFKEAGMNISEWSTNSVFVNIIIQSEEKSSMSTIKVLSHYWNTNQDSNNSYVIERNVSYEQFGMQTSNP
ncbi:hypothetical protein DPMN_041746 [Dreissena polymorpha]|uniref:Uncharacterized protein n=1 Tax=Dreissena polymorpha TaxID=45954 RepID=A0A9D4HY63_DREPO|nr:hypothetical protein DPMN_041746 [Dreissena polymorpha]